MKGRWAVALALAVGWSERVRAFTLPTRVCGNRCTRREAARAGDSVRLSLSYERDEGAGVPAQPGLPAEPAEPPDRAAHRSATRAGAKAAPATHATVDSLLSTIALECGSYNTEQVSDALIR